MHLIAKTIRQVIQSFTCATTHQTGRLLEDREVWVVLQFVSIWFQCCKKKKILRLNPFEAKTQMRQTPFLCHACWSQKRSCGFRESALPVPTGGEFTKKNRWIFGDKNMTHNRSFFWKAIFGRQDRNFCSARSTAPTSEVLSKASSTWTRVHSMLSLAGSQGSFSKTFKDTVCFSSLAFCLDFISLLASKTLPLAQQWAPIRLLEMTRSICFGFMEDPWPGFSLLGSQTS